MTRRHFTGQPSLKFPAMDVGCASFSHCFQPPTGSSMILGRFQATARVTCTFASTDDGLTPAIAGLANRDPNAATTMRSAYKVCKESARNVFCQDAARHARAWTKGTPDRSQSFKRHIGRRVFPARKRSAYATRTT